MNCRPILFGIFFCIYLVSGIALVAASYLLNDVKAIYDKYGIHLSRPCRYYMRVIGFYILANCLLYLIAVTCARRLSIMFRISAILVKLAILMEVIGLAVIGFLTIGIDSDTRKITMIV